MAKSLRIQATVATFICMTFSMSGIFVGSFSVFLPAVSQAMHWGLPVFTLVFTVSQYVTAAACPLGGRIIRLVGVRITATTGVVLFAGGLLALSQMDSAGLLYWLGIVCIGLGAGLSGPVVYARVVSSWYDANRALMLALVTAVAVQLSQTWVAPVARWLIDAHDWRFALRVFALAVLVCAGGAAAFLLRLNPAESLGAPSADDGGDPATVPAADAGASGTKAMRTRTYWALTLADCLAAGALVGTQTHLVPWLAGRGVSADRTTFLASVLAFSGMAGVVFCAFFADRIQSQRFIAALYLIPVSGTMLLYFSGTSFALQLLGAVLTGVALSTVTMLLPYLVTRYFGLKASAEIFGFSLGLNVVSIGTATLLISDGFDATGSFTLPMALVVGATVFAFLLMATLKPFTYTVSRTPARSESAVLASPAER